ncbi:uncharacterized protein LOC110838070 isoform X2 [Zootermopsis nevadensis]|uniref:uncharacterized protein LOC110838070 isoform X2 n=1 Tax=Zootermopsis nevadensis TaxID=136037 RepID=UPI000B8E9158|nr:uncharacterized protein LOC110838070 isoform X2 [Zootermopsis nevadensis]
MQGDDTVYEQGVIDGRFRVITHLMTVGATPIFPDRTSLAYRAYQMIIVVSAYLTFITAVIGILKNFHDEGFVMEAARTTFTMINVLWTHFFTRNMQGVRNLVRMAREWSELAGRVADKKKDAWISRIQIVAWRGSGFFYCIHIIYLVLRIVSQSNNILFYNSWIPFETETNFGYYFILVVQALGSILYACLVFAIMTLFASLLLVVCSELEMLQGILMEMKQNEGEPQSAVKESLAQWVKHHQQILRYLKELEDTFNVVLLGPLLSVAVILCLTAYTAVTISGNFVEIIQICLITSAMLSQLQIFCYFGNELTIQVLNETYTYFMFLLNFSNNSSEHK